MKYSFYISIISILFSLVTNLDYDPVFYTEINNEEVRKIMAIYTSIWIYTKIEKSSQIVMEITCENERRIIKKEDIKYGKYFKETNTTEMSPIENFVANNNKYICTYDVSKGKNDYGILQISNLLPFQTLTIKVNVLSKTTYWIIIVVLIIVALAVIIGLLCLCRFFLRCCAKR